MKYIFKQKDKDGFIGDLYTFKDNGLQLFRKKVNLKKVGDPKITASILCQFISEGESLKTLCAPNSECFPSLTEFYHWVKKDTQIAGWFSEAQANRNQTLIESYYKKINDYGEITEESVKGMLSALRKISEYLAKDQDAMSRTIVNTKLWSGSDKLTAGYDEDN